VRGTGAAYGGIGRGAEWGTVVHRALQLAAGSAVEELRTICRGILTEADRPLTEHGEPTELDELVDLVTGFHASPLWQRARAADPVLIEVPFAIAFSAEDAARLGIPALDGPVGGDSRAAGAAGADGERAGITLSPPRPRQIVEGVIDLAFRDADGGWIIADYKTDIFANDTIRRARTEQYRRQVDLYALCWARLTGEPVKERVLVFTGEGRKERW
jgi:ATP-dependent exoDNAse (exonuclease V) beta subunit